MIVRGSSTRTSVPMKLPLFLLPLVSGRVRARARAREAPVVRMDSHHLSTPTSRHAAATDGSVRLPSATGYRAPAADRPVSASAVFAFVVDHRMWRHAAVAIQQLNNLRTALPIVIFNHTALPVKATQAFTRLGALSLSLEPPMPVPAAFSQHLGVRRNLIDSWPKLGVW